MSFFYGQPSGNHEATTLDFNAAVPGTLEQFEFISETTWIADYYLRDEKVVSTSRSENISVSEPEKVLQDVVLGLANFKTNLHNKALLETLKKNEFYEAAV